MTAITTSGIGPLSWGSMEQKKEYTAAEAQAKVRAYAKENNLGHLKGWTFFGAEMWKERNVHVGPEPLLTSEAIQKLLEPCRIANDDRLTAETHLLLLMPATINGRPFTLDSFAEHLNGLGCGMGPRRGNMFAPPKEYVGGYREYAKTVHEKHGEVKFDKSHWILITKKVVEKTREQPFVNVENTIKECGKGEYRLPKALEALVSAIASDVINPSDAMLVEEVQAIRVDNGTGASYRNGDFKKYQNITVCEEVATAADGLIDSVIVSGHNACIVPSNIEKLPEDWTCGQGPSVVIRGTEGYKAYPGSLAVHVLNS